MSLIPVRTERESEMFRYGEQVVIRDGSKLDGATGIVYRVNQGEVQVLLDREVFWMVAKSQLERGDLHRVTTAGSERAGRS